MIDPDLQDCTYTAEVLRTHAATSEIAERILGSVIAPKATDITSTESGPIALFHGFTTASRVHHRAMRTKVDRLGERLVPRQKAVSGRERFVYDVLVAQRGRHTVLAVPFHGLAEEFFPRVDRTLAGTRTAYERLDITKIVLALGQSARLPVAEGDDRTHEIGLTRCHLRYRNVAARESRDIENVQITGANLGATGEYAFLIRAVLEKAAPVRATPLVLGFSLYIDQVRKANAVTDTHGNFKVFIGPGLRQLVRLFDLLEALEGMADVVGTTTNLPILQSRGIEGETAE